MNAEHILHAMGMLDDTLIQEAERYRRPQMDRSRWIGLAAGFAVVLALGYGVSLLGNIRTGGSVPNDYLGIAGAPGSQQSSMSSTDSAQNGGAEIPVPDASVPAQSESPSAPVYNIQLFVTDGGTKYTYSCQLDELPEDKIQVETSQLDTLPDNCRSLGKIVRLESANETRPYTDIGWYVDCSLWIQGSGWQGPVYLELPAGGYLVFEHSETHN